MNYKKLIEDFHLGTLDKDRIRLVVDVIRDSAWWEIVGELDNDPQDHSYDNELSSLYDVYGACHGTLDFVELMNAAGVPTVYDDE